MVSYGNGMNWCFNATPQYIGLHAGPKSLMSHPPNAITYSTLTCDVNPGEAADALLARTRGHQAGDTLGGMLEARGWLEVEGNDGALITQLSQQQVLVGSSHVSSWLLQQSLPASTLLPSEVQSRSAHHMATLAFSAYEPCLVAFILAL